jgi:Repeat of unknown function (DUF5648)
MIIKLDYDSSVNAAPAQFKTALNSAVGYLDSLITNAITVTFQIGWGENEGVALGSTIANGGPSGGTGYSYFALVNALKSHATTSVDNLAYSNLPTIDPTNGGHFYVGGAQEKALGLLPANSTEIDGTLGFGVTQNWDFDPTNGIGSGQIDFNGVALHELTHALGRIAGLQYAPGWYESLDLFRYRAAGQLQLVDHQPAYFSVDGGHTNLKNFDTAFDSADWSDDGVADSFGYGYSGEVLPISNTDLKVMDVLGYTLKDDTVNLTAAASINVNPGVSNPISGVQVVDDDLGETFKVMVTDAAGNLSATGSNVTGSGTHTLQITGTLSAANAALATLGYNSTSSAGDTISVTVTDSDGSTITKNISVTMISRVERFFDTATNDHFYTASVAEANQIRATLPTYHDEGSPWGTPAKGTGAVDVFRFFDTATGDHFYTNSAAERDSIIAHNPTYHFEGVAFEAYTAPGAGTLTLERFFNTIYGVHHYSASVAETAAINAGTVGPGWVEEGPGFIVHT